MLIGELLFIVKDTIATSLQRAHELDIEHGNDIKDIQLKLKSNE